MDGEPEVFEQLTLFDLDGREDSEPDRIPFERSSYQ
jgi:hypothetical protein